MHRISLVIQNFTQLLLNKMAGVGGDFDDLNSKTRINFILTIFFDPGGGA